MIILVASLDLLKEPNAACILSGCVHRKRLCTSPHVIPLSSHVTWAMSRAVSCLANSGRHAIALVCQGLWARPRRQRAPLSPAPGDTAAGASDTAAKWDAWQNLWIRVLSSIFTFMSRVLRNFQLQCKFKKSILKQPADSFSFWCTCEGKQ